MSDHDHDDGVEVREKLAEMDFMEKIVKKDWYARTWFHEENSVFQSQKQSFDHFTNHNFLPFLTSFLRKTE